MECNVKKFVLIGAVAALGACSSTDKVAVMDKPVMSYEDKVEAVEQQIEIIPEWYLEPPKSENAIYATGTSASPDLQLSMDIAVLSAKTTLADRINGRVRSQTKSFMSRIGTDVDAAVLQEVEKATKNIIADVDVAGYRVDKSHVVQNGNQYRAYVMLEYSDSEANKILANRLRQDRVLLSKIRSTQAYQELDAAVDKQHELDDNKARNNIELELGVTSE
jgi:hypothetical protein